MAEGDGKTVLVTGGSGFLAGWCIIDLLQRGYRVRTTVRDPAANATCTRRSSRRSDRDLTSPFTRPT